MLPDGPVGGQPRGLAMNPTGAALAIFMGRRIPAGPVLPIGAGRVCASDAPYSMTTRYSAGWARTFMPLMRRWNSREAAALRKWSADSHSATLT